MEREINSLSDERHNAVVGDRMNNGRGQLQAQPKKLPRNTHGGQSSGSLSVIGAEIAAAAIVTAAAIFA